MVNGSSLPTIEAEGVILELVVQGDLNVSDSNTSADENVSRFAVAALVQREIEEFVRKKLNDSIGLKRYEVSKEIEWLQKFIDLLDQQEVNNHVGTQPSSWTPAERQEKLTFARQRLQDLQLVTNDEQRNAERAGDVLGGRLDQIRLMLPGFQLHDASFELSNEVWKCVVEGSETLRKIRMIGEKVWTIEEKLEVKFWVAELKRLVEELDEEKKRIAVGLLIELALWKKSQSSSDVVHTASADVFNGLLNDILLQEPLKDPVLVHIELFSKQFLSANSDNSGVQLTIVDLLAATFLQLHANDQASRKKIGTLFCEQMIRVMQRVEVSEKEGDSMIEVLESVLPRLSPGLIEKFDNMFVLIETMCQRVPGSLQGRMASVLRYRRGGPVRPDNLPLLAAAAGSSHQSIRSYTVYEHSIAAAPVGLPVQTREEEMAQFRRRIEEETRKSVEEEYKRKEELRREEARRREEQEEERRKAREEFAKLQRQLETLQVQQEEERKKRVEEEERRRIQAEEEARRIREETELRLRAEAEAERKRKAAEEEARRLTAEAEQERIKQLTKCTFLNGITLYLHTDPQKTYNHNSFNGKVIGLLFSGYWCGPCQEFVPKLRTFYEQVEDDFEVLFISSDRNEAEMNYFMQQMHGNWFNLPFGSQNGEALSTSLSINSIPNLVIIRPNGKTITMNGVAEVQNCQNPVALVRQWKSMLC